mmetsp:Transcript_37815/g.70563  ORF Transcript_37815/g.70563 Transcript_37815/m.70563 type:complete len:320 (-) Transcript_37815:86-1045(-)
MLNTPPDATPQSPSSQDAEAGDCFGTNVLERMDRSSCKELVDGDWSERASDRRHLAVVEVARQVVEVKRLEASTMVELERLRQRGATERTRLSEESRTQRSACVAAVAKRAMEEHHQTERQKIECNAQVQQAAIAARAEVEAQVQARTRPVSHWLFLWLVLDRARSVRRRGLPVLRVAVFLLVMRGIWSAHLNNTPLAKLLQQAWRAVLQSVAKYSADQRSLLPELPELPELPCLSSLAGAADGTSNCKGAYPSSACTVHKELSEQGLAEYSEALARCGYDMDTLRELKQDGEVQEMFSAINCKSEHRAVFLRLLSQWQ